MPPLPIAGCTKAEKIAAYQNRFKWKIKNRKQDKLSVDNQKAVEAFEPMWRAGMAAGCPVDQLENLTKSCWMGQPKQLEMSAAARKCDHRCQSCSELYRQGKDVPKRCRDCGPMAIGVGGARGGGKSAWLAAQVWLDDCQRFPGLKFLYLRKSAKALREQIRDLLRKTCLPGSYNYREQVGEVHFPNGSFVIIGHFKDESEIDNYLGQEYDGMAIEELTTLTWDKFDNLTSCLRTSKPNWRPRLYAAWNWGGIGHHWVKALFYQPWLNKDEVETRYILATVHDNRFNNPEYINKLKSYQGWKYKSWYEGNPDFQAGQFFTNWSPEIHVFPNESVKFDREKITRWFGSMDYGFTHPNCFHLHGEDDEGNIFTLGECHHMETLIQDHAENFKDLLRINHLVIEDLEFVAAGHDCFKVDKDGSTVATEYVTCGIMLIRVQIDRVNAWSQMQERLGDASRGIRPTWFIHKSCHNLIVQIPVAQSDPKKPGDILKMNADAETGEGGDDALDCVSGDTMVITEHEDKKISDLTYGDMVLTSCGLRRVLKCSTRLAAINKIILTNGIELKATNNHPVWSNGEWITVDSLRNGDTVSICQKQSRSKESNSGVIQNRTGRICGTIIGREETTEKEELVRFIRKCGGRFTDQFQKAITSIIGMATHFTMKIQTLNVFPQRSILRVIQNWSPAECCGTWNPYARLQMNGTEVRREENSQEKTLNHPSENHFLKRNWNAIFAEVDIRSSLQTIRPGSAPQDAKRQTNENKEGIWKKETAKSVAQRSRLINPESPELARAYVVAVFKAGIEPVFNLTVEEVPEYFANGVLVHNCGRNGLVMAFSTLLANAKPIQMGNYKSLTGGGADQEIDTGEVLIEQEID